MSGGGAPKRAEAGPRGLRPAIPLFLERDTYRRRRLMDAARLLPIFGGALMMVPVFWSGDHRTSSGLLYLFGVWLALIVVAALIARRLAAPLPRQPRPPVDGQG